MWASAKSRFCSKVSWQQRASSGITF
jgi:hypothetical protein